MCRSVRFYRHLQQWRVSLVPSCSAQYFRVWVQNWVQVFCARSADFQGPRSRVRNSSSSVYLPVHASTKTVGRLFGRKVTFPFVNERDDTSGIERVGVDNLLVLFAPRSTGGLITRPCD